MKALFLGLCCALLLLSSVAAQEVDPTPAPLGPFIVFSRPRTTVVQPGGSVAVWVGMGPLADDEELSIVSSTPAGVAVSYGEIAYSWETTGRKFGFVEARVVISADTPCGEHTLGFSHQRDGATAGAWGYVTIALVGCSPSPLTVVWSPQRGSAAVTWLADGVVFQTRNGLEKAIATEGNRLLVLGVQPGDTFELRGKRTGVVLAKQIIGNYRVVLPIVRAG